LTNLDRTNVSGKAIAATKSETVPVEDENESDTKGRKRFRVFATHD